MGGSSECEGCKWRDNFYWNRLEAWSFHVVLATDFTQRLKIPRKFADGLGKKLPDNNMLLTGPGRIAWPIRLARASGEVFFDHGWEKFVTENFLEQGDALVFNYRAASGFDVLVYEKSSGCEKLASLFAKQRRCTHPETINHEESSPCNGSCSRRQAEQVLEMRQARDQNPEKQPLGRKSKQKKHAVSCSHGGKLQKSTPPISLEKASSLSKLKKQNDKTAQYLLKRYAFFFQSNRRGITEEERACVRELALSVGVKNPSFMAVMVPTNVTYKFFMVIPEAFVKSELRGRTGRTFTLSLIDAEKEWTVGYSKGRVSGLAGSGWTKFVWDNNLEEGDALVFELSLERRHFDVQIFRVVKQTVPLIRVGKNNSRRCVDMAEIESRGPSHLQKSPSSHHSRIIPPIRKSGQGKSKERKSQCGPSSVTEKSRESKRDAELEERQDIYAGDYSPYQFFFKSNRRPVTAEEEERAFEHASSVQPANPYFLLTMQKTHVTARFYLNVPSYFLKRISDTFFNEDQEVFLCVPGGRTHLVWYNRRKTSTSTYGGGGFEKGWLDFVLENNLEQGDVLVFELCPGEKKPTFSVQIFRVVEDVVPLTKTWKRQQSAEKRPRITEAKRSYRTRGTEKFQQMTGLIIPKSEPE
ncbi:hypothetical protein H6P81_009636 [Aristolochia fimbriata]|uniref:TF-B3 domain-containing protein n=1 Tax=Aristolochia fimbriata TaxID=158543 RepID=A0AAV7EPP1_ARIFI|nr:hypothetical protein H6P81_009636 [Aristolochia fimbriata]